MAKPKSSSVNTRNWVGAIFKVCVPDAMNLARRFAGLSEVKPTIDKVRRDTGEQQSDLVKMIRIPNKNYSLGETVVTQGQWEKVMGTEPWKGQSCVMEGDDYPAVYVSWRDAVAFCEKLSSMENKAYRLPTEAEWEYACRGGSSTDYHFGNDSAELGRYAWFYENTKSERYPHRVAQKEPNKFGLYDMHGNVLEWCLNLHNNYYNVLRGGSWNINSDFCSAGYRSYDTPESLYYYVGFRLASTISP
jgi:formylglycine-generating enzyme required for sulfatase activity